MTKSRGTLRHAKHNPEAFPIGRTWASLWEHEQEQLADFFALHGDKAREKLDKLAEDFFREHGR